MPLISRVTMTIVWEQNNPVTNFHVPASIVPDQKPKQNLNRYPLKIQQSKRHHIFAAKWH